VSLYKAISLYKIKKKSIKNFLPKFNLWQEAEILIIKNLQLEAQRN
jgi:hypothetical protein